MKLIEAWVAYLVFCLDSPMQAPVCRPFWYWVMVASFVVALAGALAIAWSIISYRMKLAAALKAEEERQAVAPPEVMERYKWAGDDAIVPGDARPSVRPPLSRPE